MPRQHFFIVVYSTLSTVYTVLYTIHEYKYPPQMFVPAHLQEFSGAPKIISLIKAMTTFCLALQELKKICCKDSVFIFFSK